MGLPSAARAFDDISEVYDATRSPPAPATIARVVAELREAAISRVVEVGVGTGRIARPLADAGVAIVGVDAARRMLAKARAKGVSNLFQAGAHHLPFRDRAFDAALFVHVLHVVDRPGEALREAARVARVGVFALVTPTRSTPRPSGGEENPMRLLVRDLAAHGVPVPDRPRAPGQREAEFLAAHPPDATVTLVDQQVTERVDRRLEMVARRASRHFLEVPPDLLAEAVARVRARVGDRTHTFRRVELLVRWDSGRIAP